MLPSADDLLAYATLAPGAVAFDGDGDHAHAFVAVRVPQGTTITAFPRSAWDRLSGRERARFVSAAKRGDLGEVAAVLGVTQHLTYDAVDLDRH
jgi:hypothetical protein